MKKLIILAFTGGCLWPWSSPGIDLKESKFTQVVNSVQVISAADKSRRVAAVNDFLKMPDVLRTGPDSRAELVAADKTITRVGANTIFSFDVENRTIDLQQGSLLFHSPHGMGGGTIRTATATAAVVGTTIIVTCTPDGGFKLLDLEGQTEIRFLNGLKQYLEPGQMTFILPGGKQPSPIIIFRLDTQSKGSLLVNGFDNPLPSLPLINDEIVKQLQLIENGRAVDTGLIAGDSATRNSVQVFQADPGTLQTVLDIINNNNAGNSPGNSTPPPNAVVINAPTLDTSYITFLTHTQTDDEMSFAAPASDPNIIINTPTIDLSPFTTQTYFDFVAPGTMTVNGSVTFTGFAQPLLSTLLLEAGALSIASGSTLEADVQDFILMSSGGLALNQNSLANTAGNIDVASLGTLNVQNSSLHAAGSVSITGGSSVAVTALPAPGGNVTVNNSSITADSGSASIVSTGGALSVTGGSLNAANSAGASTTLSGQTGATVAGTAITTDPVNGSVNISSAAGSITVNNGTSIQAGYLTLNSGDGILLDGTGATFTGSGPASSVNMTATTAISVNNADFSSFATVNMASHTINLQNVAFNGTGAVNLASFLGAANFGSSVAGDVNFIGGVTYGGNTVIGNLVNPVAGQVNLSSTGIRITTSGF